MTKKQKNILTIVVLVIIGLLLILVAFSCRDSNDQLDNKNATNKNAMINSEPVVQEDDLEQEMQDSRDAWQKKLVWDDLCKDVDIDLYDDGVYEYKLDDAYSIVLLLCRVGGTSNTYYLYHYNHDTESADRLEIDMYEASGSSTTQKAKYDRFASVEDYADFETTGKTLKIHDHSNGLDTCGVEGDYEWNDELNNYDLESFKGNLFCETLTEEEDWPVLE